MAASININDIPAETRRKLGLKKTRQRIFTAEQTRSAAIKVLAAIADLQQDQRRRVLDHAIKLNRV